MWSLPAAAKPPLLEVAVLVAVALRPPSPLVMASPEIRSLPPPASMKSLPASARAAPPPVARLVALAVLPSLVARASPATMSVPSPVRLLALPGGEIGSAAGRERGGKDGEVPGGRGQY